MRVVRTGKRSGAHAVECAIIFPIVLFFIVSIIVGGMGIFRYQQVCYLAREGARYAVVHAGQYQQENAAAIQSGALPNVDDNYLLTNVIMPNASNLDPSSLTVGINFNLSSGSYDWDDTANNNNRWPNAPKTVNGTTYNETNTVSVTVTYTWFPELYLFGPITLTSTSVMPVCY
jgi:Flp pilus assembly protein TadG